jgi:hypothetical protein
MSPYNAWIKSIFIFKATILGISRPPSPIEGPTIGGHAVGSAFALPKQKQ